MQQAAPMVQRNRRVQKYRGETQGLTPKVEQEIGTTGLRQFGGFVLEEWLAQLQGRRAAWAYREMMDNDPVVGAILFAIEMLARGVNWRVQNGDAQRAEFIESCMHDMSHTWLDFISEALSMLPYGWAYHEIVYKRRLGPQERRVQPQDDGGVLGMFPQPQGGSGRQIGEFGYGNGTPETQEEEGQASSEFKDGKLGWRKIPGRAQETLLRWHFNGYSGIDAMEQIDWHGGDHIIPIEKALLFRTKTTRNNPEGRSILRNAWTSFYRMTNIQQIEAIGIERDLAGIPVASPPPGVDLNSPAMAEVLAKTQQLVTSIRRDEDEGVVLPADGWELSLLTTGGARQIDTSEVIRRYEQRIASSCLADFVLLGQDALGSYAMVDIKSELFGVAIDTILDIFCGTMNEHAIPRLLKLNGMKVEDPPEITHSGAGRLDLEKIGRFLQSVALAGGPIPWSKELIEELFKEANLPANFDGALETRDNPTGDVHREGANGQRQQGPQNDGRERTLAKPKLVEKADGTVTVEGVAEIMGQRAHLLAGQLEAEMQGALADLGEEASTAYLHEAQKAKRPTRRGVQNVVNRVMNRLNVKGWVDGRLLPILRNHAGRVALDAQRVLQRELGIDMHLAEDVIRKVTGEAGSQLKVSDIDPQVRASIIETVQKGVESGANPLVTARMIRDAVPAGRFTGAGSAYRAQLIARNETANLQRQATLGLYKSNPRVTAVVLRDGIYGPPRSDEACIERDGEIVPIDDAEGVAPYHPLCTLGFDAMIGPVAAS